MPNIRPISDLKNSAEDISKYCRETGEAVYITKDGVGDMVIISLREYERQKTLLELYNKLAEAEEEIENGAIGEDFASAAEELRCKIHGRI